MGPDRRLGAGHRVDPGRHHRVAHPRFWPAGRRVEPWIDIHVCARSRTHHLDYRRAHHHNGPSRHHDHHGRGSLPQTEDFPSTDTPQFTAAMDALWNGIVSNSVTTAMPAFFPEAAYLQLKTISGAQSDFEDRLVGDFGLDIGAAHAVLGADAAQAQFVGVNVPASFGHWVPPGVCYNDVGYFEVPNSRVVYEVNGQTESFGIASMISWRGQWYVVHLGAVIPPGGQGVVDDPETGPGSSAPSSTC